MLKNLGENRFVNYVGIKNETETIPEAAVRAIHARQLKLRTQDSEAPERTVRTEVHQAIMQSHDTVHPAAGLIQSDKTASSEPSAATIGHRHIYAIAILSILLSIAVLSLYYLHGHFNQRTQKQARAQLKLSLSDTLLAPGIDPPAETANVEAEQAQTAAMNKPELGNLGGNNSISLGASTDQNATQSTPSSASDTDRTTRQKHSKNDECEEVVFALGLCKPIEMKTSP